MTQSAIDWDFAPDCEQGFDPGLLMPAVLPRVKKPSTRRVGVVKLYTPRKSYGLVATTEQPCDAIFNIDDVAPSDRALLDCGQTVTFEIIAGPDGNAAKQIRIDATTLPPPPDDSLISKGWR